MVEELLSRGANANIEDEKGHTPIGFAAAAGHLAVVGMLVAARADVNIIDVHGHGPLFAAVDRRRVRLVPLLLRAGCDVAVVDENGHTPLSWAKHCGFDEIARLMIERKKV